MGESGLIYRSIYLYNYENLLEPFLTTLCPLAGRLR